MTPRARAFNSSRQLTGTGGGPGIGVGNGPERLDSTAASYAAIADSWACHCSYTGSSWSRTSAIACVAADITPWLAVAAS